MSSHPKMRFEVTEFEVPDHPYEDEAGYCLHCGITEMWHANEDGVVPGERILEWMGRFL